MPRDYHELPDEAHTPTASALPADFSFNDSEPPPDPDFKESGGRFRKGFDPRRHVFTVEELSAGFWAGLASYGEQRRFGFGLVGLALSPARRRPGRRTPHTCRAGRRSVPRVVRLRTPTTSLSSTAPRWRA